LQSENLFEVSLELLGALIHLGAMELNSKLVFQNVVFKTQHYQNPETGETHTYGGIYIDEDIQTQQKHPFQI
jgi:hypothetical protein